MKVEGTGSTHGTTAAKKAKKTGSSEFSRHIQGDDSGVEETASGVSGMSGVGGVDALLALQQVDDATTGRSKARQRGNNILDQLEDLRLDLLTGGIPPQRLQQLVRLVQAQKGQITDPKLVEVLEEIDLRAQVELAKFTPRSDEE